jgi:splicing factor 3A subunit 3
VNSKEVVNSKEIALMETKMNKLCDLLDEVSLLADNQRTKSQCDTDQEDGKETG